MEKVYVEEDSIDSILAEWGGKNITKSKKKKLHKKVERSTNWMNNVESMDDIKWMESFMRESPSSKKRVMEYLTKKYPGYK